MSKKTEKVRWAVKYHFLDLWVLYVLAGLLVLSLVGGAWASMVVDDRARAVILAKCSGGGQLLIHYRDCRALVLDKHGWSDPGS